MYAKVFTQIYDGTLCTNGPWEALVTFQQLLVLADQDGTVDMTAGAIARRTTIPLAIIEKGLAALALPDPESRTPTEEGRRIVLLDESRPWGWRVVNYCHYRAIKREEDRRQYHREYWHAKRSKAAKAQPELNDSTQTQHAQPNQPIAEAEAHANTVVQDVSENDSGKSAMDSSGTTGKRPKASKAVDLAIQQWIYDTEARGERCIPEDDAVFAYAKEVGLPWEFLRLAWCEFTYRYSQPGAKKYKDWRSVYRRAIRENWLKLWWLDPAEKIFALTTVGLQAQRAHQEKLAA